MKQNLKENWSQVIAIDIISPPESDGKDPIIA